MRIQVMMSKQVKYLLQQYRKIKINYKIALLNYNNLNNYKNNNNHNSNNCLLIIKFYIKLKFTMKNLKRE